MDFSNTEHSQWPKTLRYQHNSPGVQGAANRTMRRVLLPDHMANTPENFMRTASSTGRGKPNKNQKRLLWMKLGGKEKRLSLEFLFLHGVDKRNQRVIESAIRSQMKITNYQFPKGKNIFCTNKLPPLSLTLYTKVELQPTDQIPLESVPRNRLRPEYRLEVVLASPPGGVRPWCGHSAWRIHSSARDPHSPIYEVKKVRLYQALQMLGRYLENEKRVKRKMDLIMTQNLATFEARERHLEAQSEKRQNSERHV